MNTEINSKNMLQRFKRTEIGSTLYNSVQKQGLLTAMAPATAISTMIVDQLKPSTQTKNFSILWLGDSSALKPDAGRWMGLIPVLTGMDDIYIELNIIDENTFGMETPWAKSASALPDLDIIRFKEAEDYGDIKDADLIIVSHPKFVAMPSSHQEIIIQALGLKKRVFGMFWSYFDALCESMYATKLGLGLGDNIDNPIQLESNSSGGDRITSVISEIVLNNSESTYSNESIDFFAHMRNLSGIEGHSNQFNKPGSKVANISHPFALEKPDYIHLIDNYVIDKKTRYIFRISHDEGALRAITQVMQCVIDEIDQATSLQERLMWAFKVKAMYLFDIRLFNLPEAHKTLEYFVNCFETGMGTEAGQILGAQILGQKHEPVDYHKLDLIGQQGWLEAIAIKLRVKGNLKKITHLDLSDTKLLSDNGLGEFSLLLSELISEEGEKATLISTAASQFERSAMYECAITLIEQLKVHEGLDMLMHSAVLGDDDAMKNFAPIIKHLKSEGLKSEIPLHHLRNSNKFTNIG